jgi:transposase
MKKTGRRLRHYRRFSEDFKLKLVQEYEKGIHSVPDMERLYGVGNSLIYRWIYKYSKYQKESIQVVEMKDSQLSKIKSLEARVKDLERAVGQKQMCIDYLEKMIELAKEEYDIDIKKNSNTPLSGGSGKTES